MIPVRSASRFVLLLSLLYVALVIPWPGIHSGYVSLFHKVGAVLLPTYGDVARVSFRPPPSPQQRWDTEIHVQPFNSAETWHLEMSARGWGYLPTIAFVALTLASPVTLRTKGIWLLIGLTLVHLFIFARVLIAVHFTLHWGGAIPMSPTASQALKLLFESVSASPVATFLAPAIIWLGCVAAHQRLRRLRTQGRTNPDPSP